MDDLEAFFSAESLTRFVTRHPALQSATNRGGIPLAEHAARAADPEVARVFRSERGV